MDLVSSNIPQVCNRTPPQSETLQTYRQRIGNHERADLFIYQDHTRDLREIIDKRSIFPLNACAYLSGSTFKNIDYSTMSTYIKM